MWQSKSCNVRKIRNRIDVQLSIHMIVENMINLIEKNIAEQKARSILKNIERNTQKMHWEMFHVKHFLWEKREDFLGLKIGSDSNNLNYIKQLFTDWYYCMHVFWYICDSDWILHCCRYGLLVHEPTIHSKCATAVCWELYYILQEWMTILGKMFSMGMKAIWIMEGACVRILRFFRKYPCIVTLRYQNGRINNCSLN